MVEVGCRPLSVFLNIQHRKLLTSWVLNGAKYILPHVQGTMLVKVQILTYMLCMLMKMSLNSGTLNLPCDI